MRYRSHTIATFVVILVLSGCDMPTASVSTSTSGAESEPVHLPTPTETTDLGRPTATTVVPATVVWILPPEATYADGIRAIVPRQDAGSSQPAITETDVRDYLASSQSWLGALDPTTVIDELICLRVEEAMQLIQQFIYRPTGTIVCVVRLSGTFDSAMLSLPEGASPPLELTQAQAVFDAMTGNLLEYSLGE